MLAIITSSYLDKMLLYQPAFSIVFKGGCHFDVCVAPCT